MTICSLLYIAIQKSQQGRGGGRVTGKHPPATLLAGPWSSPEAVRHYRTQLFQQRTARKTWSESLNLISYQNPAPWGKAHQHSWCIIPGATRQIQHPLEEAVTYIFARYTHGRPLLHLASLHHYTHHYWVTGVENELREYFHLARKHCYMPGRWQRKGILK